MMIEATCPAGNNVVEDNTHNEERRPVYKIVADV